MLHIACSKGTYIRSIAHDLGTLLTLRRPSIRTQTHTLRHLPHLSMHPGGPPLRMIIHNSLDNIPALPEPIALTIGTFDGVHLGHQHLFAELKKHGAPVVVTFSNHPSEILRPFDVPAPILTLNEKLELFAQFGIAMAIVIPFTHALSQIPYDEFLKKLHLLHHCRRRRYAHRRPQRRKPRITSTTWV